LSYKKQALVLSDIYDATGRFFNSQKIARTAELTKAMLSMPQEGGIYFIVVSQGGQVISRHRACVNPQ
jgi:hypothetical protein